MQTPGQRRSKEKYAFSTSEITLPEGKLVSIKLTAWYTKIKPDFVVKIQAGWKKSQIIKQR
jgi:hypothetical protein